jgi:hypothetical protein
MNRHNMIENGGYNRSFIIVFAYARAKGNIFIRFYCLAINFRPVYGNVN